MLAHVRPRRVLHWYVPVLLALLVAAGLGTGLALALTRSFGERLGPPPASPQSLQMRGTNQSRKSGNLRLVALGDSITYGIGDSAGRGYAQRVVEGLRERGLTVTLRNLAVPGAETEDLLERLNGGPELQREIGEAELILMSIGGNDLTHSLRREAETDDPTEKALARARTNLREILARVRALNPKAPIRLVGLYNPFEIAPGAAAEARGTLLAWNSAIEAVTHPLEGILAIPVVDLFADRPDRLASDQFHPGPRGHAEIAERVLASLPEAERR
jgi:lysophospholipase L1-like esterase